MGTDRHICSTHLLNIVGELYISTLHPYTSKISNAQNTLVQPPHSDNLLSIRVKKWGHVFPHFAAESLPSENRADYRVNGSR